jgi:CheY-like chemotaxis protein
VTAHSQPNLLIVDDDERIRYLLVAAAHRTGEYATVAAAADGQAALEHICRQLQEHGTVPDLVLSDLSMPRMDGLELTRELKRRADTHDVPVVMITSSNQPNDRQDALAAGCSAFFNKPFGFEEMTSLIGSLPRICAAVATHDGVR